MPRVFSIRLQEKRRKERRLLANALKKAREQNIPLYFLDETIVGQKVRHKTWGVPGGQIQSYHFNRYERNMSVILCINADGLVCYSTQHGYLDLDAYLAFLKKIKGVVGDKMIALFYDGLFIHRNPRATSLLARYRWIRCMNEAWQSEHNLIEYFIDYFKKLYFKKKLQAFCNPNFVDAKNLNDVRMLQLVQDSLVDLQDMDMSRVIKRCLTKIDARNKLP